MKATLENGVVVEGTAEELADLIRELGIEPREPGRLLQRGGAVDASTKPIDWSEVSARSLWNRFSSDQKKLILFLMKGNRVTLNELQRHLGKQDGIDVAGPLTAITKYVRQETGHPEARAIETVRDEHNNKCYQLVPEILDLLKEFQ
jgi:hypothetical protein